MARAPSGYAAADGGDARYHRVAALLSAGGQSERLHPSLRHRLTRVRAAHHDVGGVDLVFDVIGGDIGKRSRAWFEPEERWWPSSGRARHGPPAGWRSTSLSSPIVPN